MKFFKALGRKLKKAPWLKIAKVGAQVVGADLPEKKAPPPGRIERALRLIHNSLGGWVEWFETRRLTK